MMNPGGAIRRARATGRSSGPRCTPAAPTASATSGRSLTSDRDPQRTRPAPAPAPTSSRAERALEPELHRGDAAALRRRASATRSRPATRRVVGHEHEPNHRRYISRHDAPPPHRLQGIRGATTVDRNDAAEILAATDELLRALIEANDLAARRHRERALHRHPRPRRRLSRPRRRGLRLEHRGAAARHRDPGARLAAPLHPAAGACLHHPRPAAEIKHCYLRGSHGRSARSRVSRASRVTARGAERWVRGHPWIYRSDVDGPAAGARPRSGRTIPAGDSSGRRSSRPVSEIRLRLLERTERPVDAAWWRERLAARGRAARRASTPPPVAWCTAKGDGLPSLIVDRYDRWIVAQILSAGLETMRGDDPRRASSTLFEPEGILLRHDVAGPPARGARRRDRAGRTARCREQIEVREGAVRYLAAPWDGQKTGAFLDQRPNRILAGALTRPGRSGARLLRLPRLLRPAPGRPRGGRSWRSTRVAEALERGAGQRGAQRAGEHRVARGGRLRGAAGHRPRPASGSTPSSSTRRPSPSRAPRCPDALRGYREINLRAMRCLAPGGILLTASCSFHVRLPEFLGMLARGGRRQRPPHPRSPHPRRQARTIPRC